jgi:hypothetical protein
MTQLKTSLTGPIAGTATEDGSAPVSAVALIALDPVRVRGFDNDR